MSDPNSRHLPTLRFSLRSMLGGMTAFALWCGFVSILPMAINQVLIGALWIVASGWLVTGIVFARGDARAFCIGAMVVASSMWTGIGGQFAGGIQSYLRGIPLHWGVHSSSAGTGLETWLIHLVLAAAAVGNGYLCILAGRYFAGQHPKD